MAKHFSKTEFAYPVQRICGKVSRPSTVVHACTPSGKQITYLQGERNYLEHPVTLKESKAHDLFKRRLMAASARYKHDAPTYADDMAAYQTQLHESSTPIIGFQRYIWSLVMAEITE